MQSIISLTRIFTRQQHARQQFNVHGHGISQRASQRAEPVTTRPAWWHAGLLVLLLISGNPLAADKSANMAEQQQQLRTLLDAFLAGASVNDVNMHERFWAEDLVYTSSSGERYGKEKIMQELGNPPPADEPAPIYSGDQVEIQFPGRDSAVITFRLIALLPDGSSNYYYNTGVFRYDQGRYNKGRHDKGFWRAHVWQATRIPANSSE